MNKWCEEEISELIEAIANCSNPEDVCQIFDSVLTPREINDMARRLKVIKMLKEGKSYSEIKMRLGVGSEVIARVSGKIGYGFRRSEARVEGVGSGNNSDHTYKYRRGIYYKGVPSPGTLLRELKRR